VTQARQLHRPRWRGRALAVVGVLLAAAVLAVRWRIDHRSPPSILLITIDTLRADRVGIYGGRDAAQTPGIDALARRGTFFRTALSSVPLTLPSHATILSGLEPYHHGVHDNGVDVFPAAHGTLATWFKARGLATGAFVGAYVLDRRFGLSRGFDVYDDAIERRTSGVSALESERRCDAVAASATAWIGEQHGPFFAWVHFYDPHAPYDPPEPFRSQASGRPYEAEIASADACVSRLLTAVAVKDVVVALTADHGEGLGEHSEKTHGFFVYESTLRVPLILAGPGVAKGGERPWARSVDLAPTLLHLAGASPVSGLDGVNLLARNAAPRPAYAESVYPASFGWAPLRALREGALKVIAAPRPEAYNITQDAGESVNVYASSRPAIAAMERQLAAIAALPPPQAASSVDPEVEERLRALGYVVAQPAPPSSAPATGLRDPKDAVTLWNRFEEATWAAGRGEQAAAVAQFRGLVAEDPDNEMFRRSLTVALRTARLASDPALLDLPGSTDALTWHERAVLLAEKGDVAGALLAEDRAIALNPRLPEPHNLRGSLLASQGKLQDALAAFDLVLVLDPNNARGYANKGNVLRGLGRNQTAADAYRRAASLAPADPDPLNGLGVLAVQAGDPRAAAEFFREALRREPQHQEARLNLAVAEAASGNASEANAILTSLLPSLKDAELRARALSLQRSLR
jgi:arylsulfatase A-like enzyme/lipoprotein NlpI